MSRGEGDMRGNICRMCSVGNIRKVTNEVSVCMRVCMCVKMSLS